VSSENDSVHTTEPHPQTHAVTDQDVANLGLLRPPLVYLAAIVAGVGLDLVRPGRWLPAGVEVWAGVLFVILSLVLFFASTRRFKAAGTPVPGNKPTAAIVQSGPYRFSRNPIYLAFSLFVFGIACWRNSIWLLGTLAVAACPMNFVVIPREERYLKRRFGAEYLQYKAKVRRWF
jgi:protein-S-isoprenylcysteine O-methyltransferase Ste14